MRPKEGTPMADIKLTRPAAGQNVVIPSAPDARMVLDFAADQVSIDRPQGSDSLYFRFDDGSSIELQNFYTQYNKDAIPSFEVDGQLIAGADFFNAFGPDLAPAAGPSASPTRSGRYSDFANAGLEHGVNHLDGLDYRLGFGGDTQPNINPYASPFLTNAAPTLSTGGAAIAIGLTERAWSGTGDNAAPDSQRGSFSVADPDGDSLTTTVSMGGKVVAVSTAGPTTVESDYGTLVITPRGGGSNVTFEYTYTLKQDPYSPTDSLAEGEKQADNIVFSISDGKGHTVTQPINVVITGSNDAPDITRVGSALTLKEAGVYAGQPVGDKLHADELNSAPGVQATLSGTITAHDPDHGAQLYFGLKDKNGNLLDMTSVNADGSLKGTFVIGSVNNPGHSPSDVVVTGISEHNGQITISTNYGDLVLAKTSDTTAAYTFTLKNTESEGATNKLAEGQTVTLNFEPYVRDEYDATDGNADTLRNGTPHSTAITITIEGTNDAPVVTQNAWGSAASDVTVTADGRGVTLTEQVDQNAATSAVSGTFTAHDVDNGDSLTYGMVENGGNVMHTSIYVVMGSDGKLATTTDPSAPKGADYVGVFTLTSGAAGTTGYIFTMDNASPAVQGMQNGNSYDVSILLTARDSFGAYVQQSVTVTVKGANDTPVVTVAAKDGLAVKEAGVGDNPADPMATVEGKYADGNTSEHSFKVYDCDANDVQNVRVVLSGGELVEAKSVEALDEGVYSIKTVYGIFTLTPASVTDANGGTTTTYTYAFALDHSDAVEKLSADDVLNYTATITVTDEKGAAVEQKVTIKIDGTNDAPKLTMTSGTHTAEENDLIKGTFTVTDVDSDGVTTTAGYTELTNHKLSLEFDTIESKVSGGTADTPASTNDSSAAPSEYDKPAVLVTNYGTLTVKPDGTYTFEPKADALDQGDSVTLKFNVTITDRHGADDTKPIEITLTGVNDAPTGGSDSAVSLTVVESGLSPDPGANSYNKASGGKKSDGSSFTVKDVDANDTQKVSLLLDDTTVTLEKSDNGDLVYHGQYGDFIITPSGATSNKDGSYTPTNVGAGITYTYKYVLVEDKANSLGANDDINYKFKVVVTDSNTATTSQGVNVHVDAVNDIPSISWSSVGVSEAGLMNGNNTFADTGLATGQIPGGYTGGVYDPDNATNTLTFKVAGLTDGQNSWDVVAGNANGHGGAQLARNITGTDESGASITRAETVSILGQSSATEGGVAHQIIVTNYGVLNLNTATGSYTFNIKPTEAMLHDLGISDANIGTILNNINHLAQGEKLSFSFQATVTDPGNLTGTHMIGINIAGTNDKPALTLNYASTLVRHTSVSDSGKIGYEQLEISDASNSDYGAVTDSQRVYKLGNATATDDDANAREYFGVVKGHVTDGSGTLTDAGIANSALNTTQSSGTSKSTNYVTVTGDYGTLKIDANGNYSYTMDKTMASAGGVINKLTATEHLDDSFTVLVKDEFGAWTTRPITVRIDGVNDTPYLVSDNELIVNVKESGHGYSSTSDGETAYHGNKEVSGSPVVDGKIYFNDDTAAPNAIHIKDDDSTALSTTNPFAIANVDGNGSYTLTTDYGTFTLNKDGTYKFELDNTLPRVKELNQGEGYDLKVPITVQDADGGKLQFDITVKVTGTNDTPTISSSSYSNAMEITDARGVAPTISGSVANVTDDDNGGSISEIFTYGITNSAMPSDGGASGVTPGMGSSMAGSYGTLVIDPSSGKYTYTLDNNNAAVKALSGKDHLTETFNVMVRDAAGAFDIKPVTVTINGTADPMKLANLDAQVLQVREDGVAFNTNTADAGTLTANGELVVQVADNPVGNDGANHLHYGFVDVNGNVLAVGKVAAGVIEYETAYGTLKITQVDNAGGTGDQKVHFEFVLDSAKAEGLNANQQALLSGIKLAVWDDRVSKEPVVGETNDPAVAQKLDVYINGTNDRPYFTGIETGEGHNKGNIISENALSEDAVKGASITGKLVADDPDAGHTPTDLSYGIVVGDKLVQAAEGKYGILELRPNGSYTYTLTKPLPAEFQTLDNGKLLSATDDNGKLLSATDMALLQENFTVRVTDPLNAYTQTTLVIDCKGATDAPSFAVTHIGITEDNGSTQVASDNPVTKGTLALNTTDAADTTNYTGGKWSIKGATENKDGSYTYEGKYATFVLESNGSYTYTLHGNDTAEVQAFSQGSSFAENISVTVTGKDGIYRTETVTLTVNGANDAPVFGKDEYEGEVKYGVYEKEGNWGDVAPNPTGVVFTGTVAATDVDAGNKLTYALMDGTGHKVTELATEYGVITINPSTGAYTYYLNDRGLKNGSEDKINVIVTDEHGATDTAAINIDIAAASGGGSGRWPRFLDMDGTTLRPNDIQEDNGTVAHPQDNPYGGSITATGQLDARYALDFCDLGKAPDHGFGVSNNGEQVQGMQGQYGFITVNPATGAYVYTLYNSSEKVQALKADQTVTDEFYVMLDGNLQKEYGVLGNDAKIVITIKGTNDRPLVKSYDDLSIQERASKGFEDDNEAALTASGTITAKDVDGDAVTFTVKIQPAHGTVSLDPKTGEYTYTVNENLGHLKAGEVKPDSFIVEASDGHGGVTTQVIPITINGVNWAPKVVTTNPKLTVVEDADITKGGTGVVTGALSDLISDDEGLGNLSFTLESAGTGAKGSMLVQGKYGTLHITPSGQYVYTVNNGSDAVQGLDSKHPATDKFTIEVTDQHGESKTITLMVDVIGKDDAPQLTVDKVLTVTEGVERVASGQATAYDKDIADQATHVLKFSFNGGQGGVDDDGKTYQSYTNDYGTFRVYEDGAYTFDLNNASNDVKALKAGELKETSATLVVTDLNGNETTQNITVNIKGTASVPEVTTVIGDKNPDLASDHGDYGYDIEAVANAGTGQSYTAKGQIDGMDYEAGKAPVFTVQTQGSYGTLTINAEGKYTYTADAAKVEALGDGVRIKDSVTILLTAANGLTSEKTLVIDILGANDTPTITSTGWTGSGELTEQGYLNPAQADSISGTVVGHDVDTSDNGLLSYGFVGSSSVVSTLYAVPDDASFKLVEELTDHNYYGTFTMNAGTGAYTFTLNNDADCVQQMGGSDAIHISANVAVKDPHGLVATQTIGLDIHGSNDAPVVHVDGFNIYATDVDSSLSFNVQDDALYGHITQQTDGSYAYTLNVDDATALNNLSAAHVAGGIITDGADYSVSDGHTSASGAVSVGVSVDNWDGHGGHLLFSAPDANGHYTAQAASGHNVILGGDNDDILYGGTGDDILYGGAGHNELHGGDGNDHLYGGTSYGGTSNDFLDGGKGSNVLDGGAGNDVLVFHQGDHIDGGADTDMLLVSGTDTTSVDDLFNSTSNIEVIVKGSAVDSLTDMKALADKGISFNEHNQVELDAGKGWQDTHTSVDVHDVWTNTAGDLTVTIKHDDAENAKNVMVVTHNS